MLMLCLWHSVALRTLLGPMPEPLFGCVMTTLFLRTEVTIWQRFGGVDILGDETAAMN